MSDHLGHPMEEKGVYRPIQKQDERGLLNENQTGFSVVRAGERKKDDGSTSSPMTNGGYFDMKAKKIALPEETHPKKPPQQGEGE